MTGEQLRDIVIDALVPKGSIGAWGPNFRAEVMEERADAVLRAIRAAGIVMGERAGVDDLLRFSRDDTGLALVRVVEA